MRQKILFKLINFWPPFWGAGIHVDFISGDFYQIDVSLKHKWWNKNYVGTQYGGSIYSMTDPFYMLMLMQILGPDYIVWDKGAVIRFKSPGKAKLYAQFKLQKEEINSYKERLTNEKKIEPMIPVLIKDDKGNTVAEVDKILYIRKKLSKLPPSLT